MATTVHEPPQVELERRPGQGKGGWRNLVPAGGDLRRVKDSSPAPASTGIWVGIAAITMTFAAFTSALVVRQGNARDWHHFSVPPVLYLNTLIIILSSLTLSLGQRRISQAMRSGKAQAGNPANWLYGTLALGLLFVAGQTYAWLELKAQGFGLASNVSYAFFYVLTVAHALHVFGGLGGLVRVIAKLRNSTLRRSTLDATVVYWHFMGALWIYLLFLLWMKL
ncbi:MAG TPA: cytochrome c oxidase subunit 3 [Candidatus Binatia bacterium]|nr:cytochrome c oxidase subunit 3 [Candidatus Binatia bacterium]